ncbi:hypothetical protein POVCU2_0018800 [Plasmodium ovale curtisi]|uniref:Uncharacterized protein n=1 Tax=Plasmodium ovale curtisi TaxID=864141 RepID=A0A1A8VRJ1_PLAOA|nr:hypothetical protein POVCU2_0018800 [Plasmodium ovale curtisi]
MKNSYGGWYNRKICKTPKGGLEKLHCSCSNEKVVDFHKNEYTSVHIQLRDSMHVRLCSSKEHEAFLLVMEVEKVILKKKKKKKKKKVEDEMGKGSLNVLFSCSIEAYDNFSDDFSHFYLLFDQ